MHNDRPQVQSSEIGRFEPFLIALKVMAMSVLMVACSGPSSSPDADVLYDTVLLNGRVMDPESDLDTIMNVGISGGIIAIITDKDIKGKEIIDVTGLVVAPGFIDTHFHQVDPFGVRMGVLDGVTTGMDLELGSFNVGAWYDKKAKDGWAINYGTTAAFNVARMAVHDPQVELNGAVDASNLTNILNAADKQYGKLNWSTRSSNIEEMNKIMALLDEDLRQGALGVGIGAAYVAKGMTSYECFEAQRTAARYGRVTSVHTRFHLNTETPTEAPLAFDEVFTNAFLNDAPLLVCHNNDYGWWEIEEKLSLARAKGLNMWSEYYPYEAGSTIVSADFLEPAIWEGLYNYKYEETVYDPQTDTFLDRQAFDALKARSPGQNVIMFIPARKKWMKHWLKVPHMVVASDGMQGVGLDGKLLSEDAPSSAFAGHPRSAGCHARVLRMAREENVPLMFTLSQLSYWHAKHLGDAGLEDMQQRGRVQVGKIADLTLFDPLTVTDQATYKAGENGLPSVGIPYVMVKGVFVVKGSKVVDVKPGNAIRYPVEATGKHVPIDTTLWLQEFTEPILPIADNACVHGMSDH
jgi:N-acyl-D-glutamate deacylase